MHLPRTLAEQLLDAMSTYRELFKPSDKLTKPYCAFVMNVVAADTDEQAAHLLLLCSRMSFGCAGTLAGNYRLRLIIWMISVSCTKKLLLHMLCVLRCRILANREKRRCSIGLIKLWRQRNCNHGSNL